MAVAYTTYTSKAKIPFSYHFICEHCAQHSGMIVSAVEGSDSININGKGRPTPEQQAALNVGAQRSAQAAMRAKISGAAKGKYGEGVNSKCPHCGKIQSWELKSGRWKPLFSALQGLIAGFFIMLVSSFFSKQAGNMMAICIPIGFGVGLIVGLVGRIRARADAANTTVRNMPEFIWPNVDA